GRGPELIASGCSSRSYSTSLPQEKPMLFDFEKLDVYQRSVELIIVTDKLARLVPSVHRHMRDQLVRATASISLNIAEGSGKRSVDDRRRFFTIARGSAMECAAALDIIRVVSKKESEAFDEARGLLMRIVQMLSRMIASPSP